MQPRLFILDANALLHRAWHALPPLTAPDGMVVNAVYGVLMAVLKVLERDRPEAFVACWDTADPTFRHEAFEAYKAQREKQSDDLYAQIPVLQEGLRLLGVPSLEQSGFEADDLIGTLAKEGAAKDWAVTIYTGDRDLLQMVSPDITVQLFKKGMTDLQPVTPETMKVLFGLTPKQMIDYKILRGDTSDNIPGVKGIGEKGAKELLERFGTVEGLLEAAHDPKAEMTKRQRECLLAGEAEIPQWRKLVTIMTDVPLSWRLAPTPLTPFDEAFVAFLERYGFRSLLPKTKAGAAAAKKEKSPMARAGAYSAGIGTVVAHAPVPLPTPTREEVGSCAELGAWLGRHPGRLALEIIDAGGDMLAPDTWIGTETGILHLREEIWREKGFKKTCAAALQARAGDLVMHAAKDAFHLLARHGIELTDVGFDTQIAAYLLEANIAAPKRDELFSRYLGHAEPLAPAVSVMAMLVLAQRLRGELEGKGLLSLYDRFERPLVPVLFKMEEEGIMIDLPYLAGLANEFQAEQTRLEHEMRQGVGHAFNPASPIQLAQVLFQDLKLPSQNIKKGKTGFSTASSELEKLRGQHPIIEQIEAYREVAKLLSTYIQPLPALADTHARVHTTFHQTIAATGRLSSTDPNLQNIPIRTEYGRRIRKAFIAPPGRSLLSCDYAQIELRLAAALAKDEALLKAFAEGQDIHRTTAAAMWNIPLEEVTADQRRAAKTVNFGVLYGQGAFGLSTGAGVTMAEAKEFIDRYFRVYKDLRRYLDATKGLAREHGYVETAFGRRRPVPDVQSPVAMIRARAERMAINMPIQGTEADLLKLAMIEIDKRLPEWSKTARLLLQVHDELVFEVDTGEVETLATKLRTLMETVADVGVPLVVDAKFGQNWGEMIVLKRS